MDLLVATEHGIWYEGVKFRLADKCKTAKVIDPSGQRVWHGPQYSQDVHDISRIGGLQHEDTLISGSKELYQCKHRELSYCNLPQMHLVSLEPRSPPNVQESKDGQGRHQQYPIRFLAEQPVCHFLTHLWAMERRQHKHFSVISLNQRPPQLTIRSHPPFKLQLRVHCSIQSRNHTLANCHNNNVIKMKETNQIKECQIPVTMVKHQRRRGSYNLWAHEQAMIKPFGRMHWHVTIIDSPQQTGPCYWSG